MVRRKTSNGRKIAGLGLSKPRIGNIALLRCVSLGLCSSLLMLTVPCLANPQIQHDSAPQAPESALRLSAAPLATGVSFQASTQSLAQTFDFIEEPQAIIAQEEATATGSPVAPSLKSARSGAANANNIAAQSDAANQPEPVETTVDPQTSTQSGDQPSVTPASSDDIVRSPTPTPAVTAPTGTQKQADFVPPYTDNLEATTNKPLFSPSQTVNWIIAITFIVLAALLFSWWIRRLVTNALAIDEASSNDLFQATNEQVYRFDDDRDGSSYQDNGHQQTGRPEQFHGALSDDDDNSSVERTDDDQDDREEDQSDRGEKRGFMSWIFSGNLRRQKENDESSMFDPDDEIIDVEAEPVSDDQYEDEHDAIAETADDAADNHTPDQVGDRDRDHDGDRDPGLIEVTIAPAAAPIPRPMAKPAAPTPTPVAPASVYAPAPVHTPAQAEPSRNNFIGDKADYSPELEKLEMRQRETAEAIADLRQKYTAQSQKINAELGNFRAQSGAFQQSINQSIETRFAAVSGSVEKGLLETRKLTEDKFAQVPKMSTENIEKKLQHLDERFVAQARSTDMNFNKLMQRLDHFATPAPQLSKLSNDTAEMKSQLSALQAIAKTPPPATPIPPQPRDDDALRKLQTSLDENQRMLMSFQAESRHTARNVEQLGDRLGRLEADLTDQRQIVSELMDKMQPHRHSSAMDPLGILSGSQTPEIQTRSYDDVPSSEDYPIDQLGLSSAPQLQPREQSMTNGHHAASAPKEVEITPIMFDPSSLSSNAFSQAATGPKRAPQGPTTSNQGGQFSYSSEEQKTDDGKTIRPLTFGFSNFDKSTTNR